MGRFAGVRNFGIPASILGGAAMARAVQSAAEKVADHVKDQGIMVEGEPGDIELPVKVSTYKTDRARATVWLAHPSGIAVQAKHGSLSKAASAAGLTIEGN